MRGPVTPATPVPDLASPRTSPERQRLSSHLLTGTETRVTLAVQKNDEPTGETLMSMDTPQFGLALRSDRRAARGRERATLGTRGARARHRGSARAARTPPDPAHARRGAAPPGRRGRTRERLRGRSPGAMTARPSGTRPGDLPCPAWSGTGWCVVSRVTLQTIADRVGVSRMTVSNAFSRPDQLSAEMRRTILRGRGGPRVRRSRPVGPGAGPRDDGSGRSAAHRVGRHGVPRPHGGRVLRCGRRGARPHRHGRRAPAVDRVRGDDPRPRHPDGRRPGLRLRRPTTPRSTGW